MRDKSWLPALAAVLAVLTSGCARADTARPPSADDYRAADALFEPNVAGLVKNESVDATWIGDDGSFWYRRDLEDGHEYVKFDRVSGERAPLFDHEAIARGIGAALAAHAGVPDAAELESPPDPAHLGLESVEYDAVEQSLSGEATLGEVRIRVVCGLADGSCTAGELVEPEPGLLPSPDGERIVLRRSDDLFLRDAATGAERRLTDDGIPGYSWGATPEHSLSAIPNRKAGVVPPPSGAWSPDGRYLVTARLDERDVPPSHFVEWVPQDGSRRPLYHPIKTAMPGDEGEVRAEAYSFDVSSGRRAAMELPDPFDDSNAVGWSASRGQVFVIARSFGWKEAGLFRVDLATGRPTELIREERETRFETQTVLYSPPNIRVLGDGDEVVWYSDRTGWGHLYLYDGQTGEEKNAITSGEWAVIDIAAVDEENREIYFTATGREAGRDAYYRHLYRTGLDGGDPVLLTPENADHAFPAAPALPEDPPDPGRRINAAAGVLLDTYSTVDQPPVTVLRSTRDGSVIAEVERADASALYAVGWRPPVRERVKAADGETDLFAVYYPPARDIGLTKHPVIDAVYGGPQIFVAPRNFTEAYSAGNPRYEASLARLGFAVVTVDGRGTPGRSAAFRDAGYPEFTQRGIDDHVAAITGLADLHPEMDLDNVGIYGWSWGGTFSAQAILSRPEFYKVSVTGAGAYDYAALYSGFEPFTGVPVFSDGGYLRTEPDEYPHSWESLDVTAMAENLIGKMLVVYADLDENVPPTQAFRLIDALTKADRRYDLMYLANRTHAGGYDPYTVHRTWDYFVEHLLGSEPPDVDWAADRQ